MKYVPLALPLVVSEPEPALRACVIIPARNEESLLPRSLDALRYQSDLDGTRLGADCYEVIVLLNNCTDSSLAVAREYQRTYPTFHLHLAMRTFNADEAHVGVARRLLMDTAYHRLKNSRRSDVAILSTDADTTVASDWVARNLAAIDAGADVVGGVIHLFAKDLDALRREDPSTYLAYQRDRKLQELVAHAESMLDPDAADPWPRHLEHFGASLACTPSIYALAGGLPPVKPMEDVAFIDELRKVGARIRHCPDTRIFTSGRLDGRAEVGLSGQLKIWQSQGRHGEDQVVDSAEWLEHRFRALAALRHVHAQRGAADLSGYPKHWRGCIANLLRGPLPIARFLELLDCDALIEEMFLAQGHPRNGEIGGVLKGLAALVEKLTLPVEQCV